MEPDLALALTLPAPGSGALLRSLHGQLRAAILDGRLAAGARMPSTRAFAQRYGVSRNTALALYDLLLAEGYLVARPRGGTYVAESVANLPRAPAPRAQQHRAASLNPFWRTPPRLDGHPVTGPAPACDFRLGSPDTGALRFDIWQRLAARAMRAQAHGAGDFNQPHGRIGLREAIARHVAFTRAVACRADQLVVTAGVQQALDLLARILVTPGKTVVAVEDPGYLPVRALFAAAGARIVAGPVDAHGLVVERLPKDTSIIYVTPSHQFPLGCAMSAPRRAALLAFAERHGALILEDDYDSEFRFGPRPLDALQTLDRAGSVFYLGTFSKSLFPAVRIGFIGAPEWALAALHAAKQYADWHCPVPLQDTLAAFIAEGHLARHVRKMRRVYGERRALLLARLEADFAGLFTPVASSAGLHLAVHTPAALDLARLAPAARAAGVGIYALAPYYAGPGAAGLAFGYGSISLAAIDDGMDRLVRLVRAPGRRSERTQVGQLG